MFGNLIDMHPTWPKEKERLTEEVAELLDEVKALEAQLAECHARTTLGGVPPGYRPWGNVKLPPPSSAESGRFDGS